MRLSALLAPTLRETPGEAESASHRLMLRAGLMRKTGAGIYAYLPLGWRALQKILRIVRHEMDAAGAQEIMLPIIQPAELWHETGRWDDYGDEMFRLTDRHGRRFCLGPTHEELITALVRADVASYRQLPLLLYQMQNKYRDERRPRAGVIRGREFLMKDAYSFDRDQAGLAAVYKRMYDAYTRIFRFCGLPALAVEADPGTIGGHDTHEFVVLSDAGEAAVVYCTGCSYAANVEQARCVPPVQPGDGSSRDNDSEAELTRVATPDVRTIDALVEFLQIGPEQMIKTLLYQVFDAPGDSPRVVAALIRGDRQLNEVKLVRALGCHRVELAGAETIAAATGTPVGFAGPIGLAGVDIIADAEVMRIRNGVTGANQADEHWAGVNPGRDFTPGRVADIRTAEPGDACPHCGRELSGGRGIEVGQIFQLGTRYSEALSARFLDESGRERPFVMGCYGIGVSRTLAAVIEQHHDEDGIVWPISVAPYQAVVVPVDYRAADQRRAAEEIDAALGAAGVEAVLDDRDERAGVKFKDADLIGFPYRITVGPRALGQGKVELRRRGGEQELLPIGDVAAVVIERVRGELRKLEGRA